MSIVMTRNVITSSKAGSTMRNEILILGATGRSGQDVAARLHASGIPLVLAGRSRPGLEALVDRMGGGARILAQSWESQLSSLSTDPPGVVVNTVGPFASTSRAVALALPLGTHYVDIANEFSPVDDILALDDRAKASEQTLVTGAGFGVLATETIALWVCAGMPHPARLRVDAMPALALDGGRVGDALAGSIIEVLRFGGREVRSGTLVRSATASRPERLVTPDGDELTTGGGASGELLAAWRASGAAQVVAASTAAPSGALVRRVALPVMNGAIRVPGVAGMLRRIVARVSLPTAPMSRPSSWAHARAEWADGSTRDGWLRVGDGSTFTADVMAETARRLLAGTQPPGAFTPGALFGHEYAELFGARITTP